MQLKFSSNTITGNLGGKPIHCVVRMSQGTGSPMPGEYTVRPPIERSHFRSDGARDSVQVRKRHRATCPQREANGPRVFAGEYSGRTRELGLDKNAVRRPSSRCADAGPER